MIIETQGGLEETIRQIQCEKCGSRNTRLVSRPELDGLGGRSVAAGLAYDASKSTASVGPPIAGCMPVPPILTDPRVIVAVAGAAVALFKIFQNKEKRRREEEKRRREEEKRRREEARRESQRWVYCEKCGHLKELN